LTPVSDVRLCLNVKGLQYKTVWVEYPDIEAICKKIGAKPTSTQGPPYTLPVIHDPSTNTVVSDSIDIVRYLDATYPSTIQLMPPGSDAAVEAVQIPNMMAGLVPIMVPLIFAVLNPASQGYFRRTRESWFGTKLEDLSPPGPQRDQHWKHIQDSLGVVDGWLTKNANGKKFAMGDTISYADVNMAAWLWFMKMLIGPESQEWREVERWHNGRWAAILSQFADYLVVIE
jgi:glutathione S-transferase